LPARIDRGAHLGRRHRQFGEPGADGALDRVGDAAIGGQMLTSATPLAPYGSRLCAGSEPAPDNPDKCGMGLPWVGRI
jgi:hypothetical protein